MAEDTEDGTGDVVLWYRESDAWRAVEPFDDPDFGTCAGVGLLRKMIAVRDGVV